MPTYQYHCEHCGYEMETVQRMTDKPLTLCPNCSTENLKRTIGLGGGFVLKGSGFYNTDYKNAPSPAKPVAQTPATPPAATPASSDAKSSESKPAEKKTDPAPAKATDKSK